MPSNWKAVRPTYKDRAERALDVKLATEYAPFGLHLRGDTTSRISIASRPPLPSFRESEAYCLAAVADSGAAIQSASNQIVFRRNNPEAGAARVRIGVDGEGGA